MTCAVREVCPRLGARRVVVNDVPENLVKPMAPAILMLRESQLFFFCDLGLCPRMRYRPGLKARLNALDAVRQAAHGLCRHDIAGFCEAYSLQAPWLGCKRAGYEVGPRACGRIFLRFLA